jgi:hypothetical protein
VIEVILRREKPSLLRPDHALSIHVDSGLRSSHYADVDSVAIASETRAATVFRIELCIVRFYKIICAYEFNFRY